MLQKLAAQATNYKPTSTHAPTVQADMLKGLRVDAGRRLKL